MMDAPAQSPSNTDTNACFFYSVEKLSGIAGWQLIRAWKTDEKGIMINEFTNQEPRVGVN
jgi:hypothetical protein